MNNILKVLLIEDDLIDQMAFKRAVKEQALPYHYAVAGSISAATGMLDSQEFDVVISDFSLGDGTLFDILDALLIRDMPVVVTTGTGDEETAVKAIKAGVNDYIIKDADRNYLRVLATTVEKALESKKEKAERERAEKALQWSEEKFRAITSSAQDGIILMNIQCQVAFWNKAAEQIFGYKSAEILGQELHSMLFSPIYYDFCREELHKLKTKEHLPQFGRAFELIGRHKMGRDIPIECSMSSFELQGESFVTIITRDITERKRAEQELNKARQAAEAADHAKGEFLANMSHEIRTPMAAIISMTELLLNTELNRQQVEFATTIFDAGQHLLTVINDILAVSKIESGIINIENKNFELVPLLHNLSRIISPEASAKNLTLETLVDPEIPAYLNCDPVRLRQILINLTTNAIKFTDQGQVTLRVSLEGKNELGSKIRFAVTDTGIGISPEDQHKLFHPFVQVDASSTRRHGGTGLGLVICKRLVEAMGGTIGLESSFGQGSTFWFVLPYTTLSDGLDKSGEENNLNNFIDNKLKPTSPPSWAISAGVPPPPSGKHPILLVEDDPVAGMVAQFQLNKLGFSVQLVTNGNDAINAAIENNYALIFMDYHMPGMDGFQATRAIRDAELSLGRHIPIIAITARAMEGDREMCLEAGMDDYISKPVQLTEMKRVLDRWII